MESNIISLSGVQCAGKSTIAYRLKSLIPESVIYGGTRELKRYLDNPDQKGTVIIVEYASSLLFPHRNITSTTADRFSKCGLLDRAYFQKGKHFFLDLQSEKTQYERLLERNFGQDDGYIRTIRKEYVYRSEYLRMLADKGYFTKTISVDDMSVVDITHEIMELIISQD